MNTCCATTTCSPTLFFPKTSSLHSHRHSYSFHSISHRFYAYNYSKFRTLCSSSDSNSNSNSNSNSSKRGFGPQSDKAKKSSTAKNDEKRKSSSQQSGTTNNQAPGIISRAEEKPTSFVSDIDFEERLKAVKRSALEQKKTEEVKQFGAIDYDAPTEPEKSKIGLGTKIGAGIAVIVFGLIFALGDFLPSGNVGPTEESATVNQRLSEEDKAKLQKRLEQFEATLISSPEDSSALEGAAVTVAELGDYKRASELLEDLSKKKPNDPDVFRLLGEVKYELKDYDGSAIAYRNAEKVSKTINFDVIRGLTNALLAGKKPDEAVKYLMASRDGLSKEISGDSGESEVDLVQVELLLGKAYSDWGHVSDAASVYDQLISKHPEDFRAYLAKGILLKQNGNIGDAERMFIQARFFASGKVKAFVDKYAR